MTSITDLDLDDLLADFPSAPQAVEPEAKLPATEIPISPICIWDALGIASQIKTSNFVFDIETGLPAWDVLERLAPPFVEPPPFDPASVKTGDCKRKDPAEQDRLTRKKIDDARLAYEAEAAQAKKLWADDLIDKSLVDPRYCRVLAIGYGVGSVENETIGIDGLADSSEADLLTRFWNHYRWTRKVNGRLGGHGISGFDIPVLVKRSWVNGIAVPSDILSNGRYLHRLFVDSMKAWQVGVWGDKWISADDLAATLGTRRKKNAVVTGKTFWLHWRDNRQAAIEYLVGDVQMEIDILNRLDLWNQ